jgi:serine protease Do
MMLFRVIACTIFLLIGSSVALALEPDEVFAKVSRSIVVVVGYNNSDPDESMLGSGVVVAPGEIVTNCHVIDNADQIWLKRNDFISLATHRFSDEARDLCQVSAINSDGFDKVIPGIASLSELRVGQKVYAVGAPQGLELTLSDGLISSLREMEDIGIIIQTSAPISHGSSGGGLFDSNGRLIGITSGGYETGQNLNFAVPASYISELGLRQAERKRRAEAERRREEMRERERKLAEKKRQGEQARRERIEAERQAKQRAAAAARAARQQLVDDFMALISAKVVSRIEIPPGISGNPEGLYEVVLLPGGDVLSAELKKSSGVPAYDAAVRTAILAAQPLPVPSDSDMFQEHFRRFNMSFRPKAW